MKKGLLVLMSALMMVSGANLSSHVFAADKIVRVTADDLSQVMVVKDLICEMRGFFYSVDKWNFKGPDYKEKMAYFEKEFYRLVKRELTYETQRELERQFKEVKSECTQYIVSDVWGFVQY